MNLALPSFSLASCLQIQSLCSQAPALMQPRELRPGLAAGLHPGSPVLLATCTSLLKIALPGHLLIPISDGLTHCSWMREWTEPSLPATGGGNQPSTLVRKHSRQIFSTTDVPFTCQPQVGTLPQLWVSLRTFVSSLRCLDASGLLSPKSAGKCPCSCQPPVKIGPSHRKPDL